MQFFGLHVLTTLVIMTTRLLSSVLFLALPAAARTFPEAEQIAHEQPGSDS